jgi:tetratricopeptide (TPR) repeat protein
LRTAFTASNPALAPLLSVPTPLASPTLADNTAAALLEFALQVWAEGVPELAQQILNTTTLLPVKEPLLQPLLPYYRALLADSAGQTALATELLTSLARRPDGFGALAKLRLNELQAQGSNAPRTLRAAAAAGRHLAAQYPNQPVFWQSALQLNLAASQYAAAAETATRLLQLLPAEPSGTLPQRQADLYFARGAAYAQAGRSGLAETDLQQAIALDPAHAEALNYLGFLWVDENRNVAEAYTLLKRAHLLAPNNGAITDSVGWAYYRQGDYDTARTYLELAAQQEPGTPEILSHLGDTYFQLGQQAEARKLWQRALELANQGADVPSPDFLQQLQAKVRRGQL